jgi:hypothetical protein
MHIMTTSRWPRAVAWAVHGMVFDRSCHGGAVHGMVLIVHVMVALFMGYVRVLLMSMASYCSWVCHCTVHGHVVGTLLTMTSEICH